MTDLLRRAWDALDSFKQAHPESWHEEDEQVLKELMWADLKLSGVQREWVGLTEEEKNDCLVSADPCECLAKPESHQLMDDVEAKLKEKNGG